MQTSNEPSHAGRNALILVLGLAVVAIFAYSMVGLSNQRKRADELASTNQSLRDSLARVQDQLQSVSSRLETLAEPKAPEQPVRAARAVEPAPKAAAPKSRAKSSSSATAANDPRWKQMQERIANQQKQIDSAQQDITNGRQDLASTREEVDKTRQDLTGRLDSTRDELGGSIAKNHDELVALERRGERTYFEFQLGKSKEFQRVGSLSLSVRKVDSKHRSYDLSLLVNDQKLDKKHVNLYEPINIRSSDQPVELVVNEIGNNQIKGYVSEPKYKPATSPSLSSSIKNSDQ